ncbi:MAG: tandem-95 repeat protein, partial [Nitrospira sp. CG24D]
MKHSFWTELRVFLFGWRRRWVRPRVWQRRVRRRLARQRSSRSAAGAVGSPFTLEPLESRLLLAADLTGVVQSAALIDPAVPTNPASAVVQVQNVGNQLVTQSQVGVYASLDTVLDSSDVLLGTANTGQVNAGASKNVTVNLTIPNTLDPTTYRLLAKMDNANAIAENSETNNVAVGGTLNVVWQFGAVPGLAGSTTLQLTDGDGTVVTFKINGPGTGMVIQDGTKWDVRVTGTDGTSILTISTNAAGNGRATIDDLFVGGPLKVVNADKVDLTGTCAVLGPLGAATFGSVNGGTIAATTMSGTLHIKGDMQNASILIGANLGQDGKLGGTGTDSDSFGAGSLPKLVINGNMTSSTVRIGVDPVDGLFGNGNDVIVGGTSSSLGALTIGGTMTDSHFFAGALPATASIGGSTISLAGNPSFGTDVQGPALVAALTQDTGSSATDRLTFNPSISGTLSDPGGIASFVAGFGSTPSFNILGDLVSGNFTLSQTRLAQINGGTLTDGNYTLTLKAIDIYGNSSQIAVLFTLDTAVAQPVFDLTPVFDTQIVGDQQTTASSVSLAGQTEANALVELLGLGLTTTADATGLFTFTNVSLALGANSLTARATDTAGNQWIYSRTITRVAAPVIDPITAQAVDEGQLLTFTATVNDADTPASGLTFSLNGTVPAGASIDSQTGVFTWTPTETQGPETYVFNVLVTDNSTPALSDSRPVQVTVNEINQAPVLTAIGNHTVNEGQLLTFTATASDIDLPAQARTFSLAGTIPAGAAIDPTSGVFTWTPTEAQGPGTFSFDVVVSDGVVTASETIQVTVGEANAAPVLTAIGNQSIDEGQLLTFTAPATDTDLPANSLTFSLANGASGLVPAGATINGSTGVFSWIPTEAQGPNSYTFDVVVSDGTATDVETIQVTVGEVNAAPVLNAIGNHTVNEGQLLTFTATASDSDLPAQALTFSLAGTVPAGAAIDATTGVFTWTPTEAQGPGTFSFDVVVSDGVVTASETIQVTVGEANAAPVLTAIGNQSIDEGQLLTFTAPATDTDLPANSLTFSLANGASGLVPAGATINGSTGVFSWIPTEAQGPNSYTFDVVVSDGTATDVETIQVTVGEVNAAPVLNAIGNHTVNEGQLLTFTAT